VTPLQDRTTRLILSLYANDVVAFINPVRGDVDVLMEIMQKFDDATRPRINVHKSIVDLIRCSQVDLDYVLHTFAGTRASFPMSYLGLPITLNRLRFSQLQPFLDRASTKLEGWQANLLNIGGRRELINIVLGSLPT
jgi:hypothetical protein